MSPRHQLPRFTRVSLALALLPLCLADARSAPVAFPAGEAPAIVFQPKTQLQQCVAERLAAYLGQVLGKPARFAPQAGAAQFDGYGWVDPTVTYRTQKGLSAAQAAWQPVPAYNTWIGVWGQPEAIMQEKMIGELTRQLGLEVKTPGWMRFREAEHLLQSFESQQRYSPTPWKFKLAAGASMRWPIEKVRDRLQLLVDNGTVEKTADGAYQLVDWDEFRSP